MILVLIFLLPLSTMYQISAESHQINNSANVVVENLSIHSFLDENFYIRLNITWGKVTNSSASVSFRFKNSHNCNQINDVEQYVMEDDEFIIVPSMEMEHPADSLTHRCEYLIEIESNENHKILQNFTYVIPECVENKCVCRDMEDSPYKLKSINELRKDFYFLKWEKVSDENLTVHSIYYHKLNNTLKTYVPELNITVTNDGIELPLMDILHNVPYRITVQFLGVINECVYISSFNFNFSENESSITLLFTIITITAVITGLIIYFVVQKFPKLRNKLSIYVPSLRSTYFGGNVQENVCYMQPFSILRQEDNAQYTPLEFALNVHKFDEYEIPRNKVVIKEELDSGEFGTVFLGKVFGLNDNPTFQTVAVKKLKEGAPSNEVEDFRNEIEILKKVGVHNNIVRLIGCVTIDEPYMMIMELVPCGSLKNYLLTLRHKWTKQKSPNFFFSDDVFDDVWLTEDRNSDKNSDGEYIVPDDVFHGFSKRKHVPSRSPSTPLSMTSSRLPSCTETEITVLHSESDSPRLMEIRKQPVPVLDNKELQNFAFQIANGMAHLEKIKIAHRDLAARNVLISRDKTLKISDFGLSRTGPYVSYHSKKLPLRWMAIEAIEQRTCDNKSDVWSFGIVLWEIATLGAFPYEKTPDSLIFQDLKAGKRLEKPEMCSEELYNVMLSCWDEKPAERPNFYELVEVLDVTKKKVYVDFNEISRQYVFPPSEVKNTL